jgi:hypothetical protein
MCGSFDNCVVVLVLCVLVFTVFFIVCTVLFYCFVYIYIYIYIYLFIYSFLLINYNIVTSGTTTFYCLHLWATCFNLYTRHLQALLYKQVHKKLCTVGSHRVYSRVQEELKMAYV